MATTTEVRKVKAEALKRGELWDLRVLCPWCLTFHHHGAGAVALSPDAPAREFYGRRMSHCEGAKGEAREYEITKG